MKYIYTQKDCPACEKQKQEYKDKGIEYVERDASRLTDIGADRDDIDVEAYVGLAFQNNTLPVVVDWNDEND